MTKTTTIKTPTLYRAGVILECRAGEGGEETRTVDLSFSSEEPVKRFFGMEILDHGEGSVNLDFMSGGRAPLLLDHDTGKHIGVVEKASIDGDRMGRATVRFGKGVLANEVFEDVRGGIRANVSVGYRIDKMVTEAVEGDTETLRAVDWTPLEISIVSVPADASVGVGRSGFEEHETIILRDDNMTETQNPAPTAEALAPATPKSDSVDTRKIEEKTKEKILIDERNRVADIQELAARHNLKSFGDEAVRDGQPIEQFKGLLLERLGETKPIEKPTGQLDLGDKDKRGYSLLRAIHASASQDWRSAAFERECSDEIAKRAGKDPQGFFVPSDIQWVNDHREQRDLTVGTNTAGGFMKGTDHLGGSFIDALRSKLVVRRLGAQVMTGLQGDIAIPAMNAKTTAYWLAENAAPTEGAPTFRQVTMAPKTIAAYVDLSRKLLIQSDPSVEQVIRNDLVSQIAGGIEAVAIEGAGSNEPTGILNTTGIGDVSLGTNGGAPTWAGVVGLVEDVEVADGADGSLAFLTNPKVKSKMSSTAKVSSTDSVMILNDPWNSLFGYTMETTNHVPSDLTAGTGSSLSAVIFGNFSQLMIGEWGTVDILVDPYSLSTTGATRVTVFNDVDVAVRHAGAFSAIQDMIT